MEMNAVEDMSVSLPRGALPAQARLPEAVMAQVRSVLAPTRRTAVAPPGDEVVVVDVVVVDVVVVDVVVVDVVAEVVVAPPPPAPPGAVNEVPPVFEEEGAPEPQAAARRVMTEKAARARMPSTLEFASTPSKPGAAL